MLSSLDSPKFARQVSGFNFLKVSSEALGTEYYYNFFFGIVRFFGSSLLWKKDQTNQKHTLIHNCSFVCFIRNERQVQTCFFAVFSRDVEDGIVRIINHKINISNPILIRITHDGHCFILQNLLALIMYATPTFHHLIKFQWIKSTSTFKNKSVLLE